MVENEPTSAKSRSSGARSAQRRERPAQHVIPAFKLARGFDADDVVRLLHHADHFRVAVAVAAILAQFAVGDVVADAAQAELILDVQDGLHQVLGVLASGAGRLHVVYFVTGVSPE